MNATPGPRAARRTRDPAARGSPWRSVAVVTAVALACSGIVSADRAGFPRVVGAAAGATAALLGVLALPSFPTRRIALALLAFGGLAAARHAALPGVDVNVLVVWAIATLFALLLVDRAQSDEASPLPGSAPPPGRAGEVLRVGAVLATLVFVTVVVLGATIATAVRRDVSPGAQPTFSDQQDASSSLKRSDVLDMTRRPKLSNDVVFTVDASHPDFWRGETFDQWTGSAWVRSGRAQGRQSLIDENGDIPVAPERDNPAATTGSLMRQTFHIEAPYSEVIFAAPTIVDVRTDELVVERPDGTVAVASGGGFGRGSSYTVISRRAHATSTTLRAADATRIPRAVLAQYAQTPGTTTRVTQLAADITATAPTTYDKVLAIERWLAANTRYSLDAPPSRPGQDAVDQFVFETRRGWCEQVASTLVVMLRSVGVPARIATGFVTGQHDQLTGRYVVRDRDAHAWAEVYFGGVGWQGFDPTASVPLAGEAGTATSWLQQARSALPYLLVGAVLVAGLVLGGRELIGRRPGRRRARRAPSWAGMMLRRVERLGRRAHVSPRPGETVREFSRELAILLGEPRLVGLGTAIDADAFSPFGVAPDERARFEATLREVEHDVRERHPRRGRGPGRGRHGSPGRGARVVRSLAPDR